MYSYFSIVFSNCIVNLGRPFNGVKFFQYAINNLYSNSRIRQSIKKNLKYTLKVIKSTLNIQKSAQKHLKST